jgi:hypothetical protein
LVVERIANLNGQIILESGGGKSQIALERSLDVNTISLPAIQLRSASPRPSVPVVTRRDQRHLTIQSNVRAVVSLEVRSATRGYLADATEIGRDTSGQRYVRWSEIKSTTPEILVRSFVGRYGADGRLTGLAEVPIDDMDYVPTGYGTVTAAGELRVLVPSQEGLEIRRSPFQTLGPIDPKTRSLSLGRSVLQTLQSSKGSIIKLETILNDQGAGGRRSSARPTVRKSLDTIVTRDEVMQAAHEFTSIKWTLGENNFCHADTPEPM